jgi:hypothetical protein
MYCPAPGSIGGNVVTGDDLQNVVGSIWAGMMRYTKGIDGSWWTTPPEGVRITVGKGQGFTVVLKAHTTREAMVAATVCRPTWVASWRRKPDHPLPWFLVAGKSTWQVACARGGPDPWHRRDAVPEPQDRFEHQRR